MSDHKPCGPDCGDTICTECAIAYTYLDERNKEKERIVAIVRAEIKFHEDAADYYAASRRSNIQGWQFEKFAAQALINALDKIQNG